MLKYTEEHEWLEEAGGIVTVGIFANRPADVLILGTDTGIRTIE